MKIRTKRNKLAAKCNIKMQTDNLIINGREADILLYGEISNNFIGDDAVLGKTIVSELLQLSRTCDTIRVHINSEGGEVYAGIAIFNALRLCSKNVEIYTDGISASIAGVIAMCGRKHYMSRFARLMIHSVSAGVYGDKSDLRATIEEIEALEATLADIISSRMGIDPEDVKSRFFDGKDHWFNAQEAVDAGLADGIYDISGMAKEEDTPEEVYEKVYTNRAVLRSQIITHMDIVKIAQKPRFKNVQTEDDILRVIDELNTQIESLESENTSLKSRISELEEAEIEKILDAAVAAGKIEEGEKDSYRSLLNSNRTATEKVISSLKPKRMVRNDILRPDGKANGSPWDRRMEEIRSNLKKRQS